MFLFVSSFLRLERFGLGRGVGYLKVSWTRRRRPSGSKGFHDENKIFYVDLNPRVVTPGVLVPGPFRETVSSTSPPNLSSLPSRSVIPVCSPLRTRRPPVAVRTREDGCTLYQYTTTLVGVLNHCTFLLENITHI